MSSMEHFEPLSTIILRTGTTKEGPHEEQCRKNLSKLLQDTGHDDFVSFGTIRDILNASDCPICQTLSHLIKQDLGISDQESERDDELSTLVRGYRSDDVSEYFQSHPLNGERPLKSLRISTNHDLDIAWVTDEPESEYDVLFQLSDEVADNTADVSGIAVDIPGGPIDDFFMKAWLRAFQGIHGQRCLTNYHKAAFHPPRGFRLIDSQFFEIVRPSDAIAFEYLALSYMWGRSTTWFKSVRSNIADLEKPDALQKVWSDLPRTIRDAIALTRGLGFRYLWVDSLCIVQDDVGEEKTQQIACMGDIYAAASLVIVAAAGSDANAGLPGVDPLMTKDARASRFSRSAGAGLPDLCTVGPTVSWAIQSSKWTTRCWTFQESLLARMQLIMTKDDSYLACTCGRAVSEVNSRGAYILTTSGSCTIEGFGEDCQRYEEIWKGSNRGTQDLWEDYSECVYEYTRRELTNPRDILNAFTAVISQQTKTWSTTFVFGLPTQYLGHALAWNSFSSDPDSVVLRTCPVEYHKEGTMTECIAPSWAWAGWIGHVLPWDMEPYGPSQPGEHAIQDWRVEDYELYQAKHPHLGLALRFSTWTVQLYIGPKFDTEWDEGPKQYPVHLCDQGAKLLTIEIHSSPYWPNDGSHVDQLWEFVAVAWGPRNHYWKAVRTTEPDYDRNEVEHDNTTASFEGVDALLINRAVNDIAYRVGYVAILMEKWKAANPVWKEVRLG